ncbi:GNAT family N-acetyltransferase [Rhodococcus sp. IEGM 1241]|uniref:GNAT family N-acetyltransferase n=2 Tax=Rhodococcus TaxID=1827 RepID=UPI0029542329|nr:GNAT family N-acetyltransferase [Rhodococcus sp. IEGM 1241]MDV8009827.1 GNAT family N-acetyltransferase [Rhodococcus sp. IEGM 1241]
MTITVRRSGTTDLGAILALMQEARGEGLSHEEKAERGFVQGRMDEAMLAGLQEGSGVFVAEEDGSFAGFAVTSSPVLFTSGPAKETVDAVSALAPDDSRFFLYGPVAVDRRFQGRGVMTALLKSLCRDLVDDYDLGSAFVEVTNAKSLAVHRHYGMTEAAHFTIDDREYAVFTFEPSAFAKRTD